MEDKHHKTYQQLLVLLFTPKALQAIIFAVDNGRFRFLANTAFEKFDVLNATEEELVGKADSIISPVIEEVGNKNIEKALLCLPSSWVDKQGRIEKAKISILNHLLKSLDFTTLGFVTYAEVFATYFKQKDGIPLNAVFFSLFPETNTISLIKSSEVVFSQEFVDPAFINKHLSSFAPLPPRILIYYTKQKKHELAKFLTQPWEETLQFIHLPTSDALSHHFFLSSLAKVLEKKLFSTFVSQTISPSPSSSTPFLKNQDVKKLSSPSRKKLTLPKLSFPKFSFPSIKPNLAFSFPLPKSFLPKLFLLAFLPLLLAFGLYFLFFNLAKAEVKVFVTPKTLTTSLTFNLSPDISLPDPTNNLIPAKIIEVSDTITKQAPATGTKLLGTKARGTVTLYNRTTLPKTFKKGTTLSYHNLSFTLQDTVTVASKSANTDYIEVPGQAVVTVRAKEIGPQYNLPANTEFQVASYSKTSFVAKSQKAFSGGTAKQVTVISKEDVDKLTRQIIEEFSSTAEQKLSSTADGKKLYLPKNSIKIKSTQLNPALESETETFSLTLTLSAKALSYQEEDIQNLVLQNLTQTLPSNYTLSTPIKLAVKESSASAKNYTLATNLNIPLLPKLDFPQITKKLAGKKTTILKNVLSALPGFKRAQLSLKPKLLSKLKLLPFNPHNITITIVSAE